MVGATGAGLGFPSVKGAGGVREEVLPGMWWVWRRGLAWWDRLEPCPCGPCCLTRMPLSAAQDITAPQRVEDSPVPADLPQRGYYLTLMANRALYPGGQPGNQLRVLRVGNDTSCSPKTRGCNHPLPGPGPYR